MQWNTAQLTIKVAQTQYEEAVVQFRQTLYTALADVEDALSATGYYRDQGVYLKEALACAIQAVGRGTLPRRGDRRAGVAG